MLRKQWVVKVFILIICGFSACSGPGTPDLPDGKSTTDSNGFEVGLDSQIDVEQDNIADGTADVVSVSKLEALPNPANPLSFYVTWETSSPVIGQVMVNCGDELTGEITASTPATEHEVYIMGLWEGATCKVAVGPASGRDEATLEWTVEPLGSPYPELTLQVLDKELVAPGWTLFNLSNKFDKIPLLVVIVCCVALPVSGFVA